MKSHGILFKMTDHRYIALYHDKCKKTAVYTIVNGDTSKTAKIKKATSLPSLPSNTLHTRCSAIAERPRCRVR